MLDPDMPAQELRLHMGELTPSEILVARAAIAWANSAAPKPEGGDGWRDISTAPKDGAHIIVSGGIAYWRTNNTYPKLSGWFTLTGEQYPGKPIQWDVTKWQPFPDLPQPPSKDESHDY